MVNNNMFISFFALTLLSLVNAGTPSLRNRVLGNSDSSDSNDNGNGNGNGNGKRCRDPAQAVLDLLQCVKVEDAACAAAAYDPNFQRFHNELFTGAIAVADPAFWNGAFTFVDFDFDIKFDNNPSRNQASVRYIEIVTVTDGLNLGFPAPRSDYPFGEVIVQHEHAIVEVDDDCKLVKWEQYGDNKEQTDVDDAVAALLCALGQC